VAEYKVSTTLEANTKRFKSQIQSAMNVVKEYKRQNRDTDVELGADISRLRRQMKIARVIMQRFSKEKVEARAGVDSSAAENRISRLRLMLRSIPNRVRVRLETKIDTGSLSKYMTIFSGLIPIVAAAVPAVMAVGNALAVVGGGAIGLAGAFGIAGAGAMAFGGMAISAISMLNDGLIAASGETQYYQSTLQGVKDEWAGLIQQNATSIFTTLGNGIQSATIALQKLNPFLSSVSTLITAASNKMLSWVATSQTASNFFNMMGTTGVSIFADLLNALGRFGDGFVNIFTQFTPLFKFMSQGLQNMATDFQKWANSTSTATGIETFIDYVKENLPLIGEIFSNTFGGIINLFKAFSGNSNTIFESLAQMTEKFQTWSETIGQSQGFRQFIDYVQTNGPVIIQMIGSIVTAVIAFATAMAPLGGIILQVVTAIAQWIAGFAQAHPQITMIVSGVLVFISALLKIIGVIQAILPSFLILLGILQRMWNVFKYVMDILRLVGLAFAGLSAPVLIVIGVIGALIAIFVLLWNKNEAFRNAVIGIWNSIKSTFQSSIEAIKGFLKGGWVAMVASAVAFGADFISQIGSAMSNFKSRISQGVADALSTLKTGISNMISAAAGFVGDFASAGSDLIMGMVNGVAKAAGNLVSAVTDAVGGAINKAKSLLGIHSPSRVFKGIGIYTMQGMENGINGAGGGVIKSMSSIANQMQSAFNPAFALPDISGNLSGMRATINSQVQHTHTVNSTPNQRVVRIEMGINNDALTSIVNGRNADSNFIHQF